MMPHKINCTHTVILIHVILLSNIFAVFCAFSTLNFLLGIKNFNFCLKIFIFTYKNFRYYFQGAADAYKEHGDASELFVIIIDEIEAICKPRGMCVHYYEHDVDK